MEVGVGVGAEVSIRATVSKRRADAKADHHGQHTLHGFLSQSSQAAKKSTDDLSHGG
jgi:hypothetical protein